MKYLLLITLSFILVSSSLVDNAKLPKPFKKQFKFIPSGLTVVDGDTLSVQSFYMLEHEVTNGEYKAFLESVKKESSDIYEVVKIRSKRWSEALENAFVEPMEKLYDSSPAYLDYPVVNITHQAAVLYCSWLEERINEELKNGNKVKVRLPLRAEFIRAGSGNNLGWQYAWGNNFLTNSEGDFLCNFTRIPFSRMSRGENNGLKLQDTSVKMDYAKDGSFFTAYKNSYYSNIYDIYNLNGNVAEWLGDSDDLAAGGSWYDFGYDVRLQSVKSYKTASPMVGFRPVVTVLSE